jgi:hypothetical protein
VQVINNHTTLGEQVIKTLLYFDIFNYPLKAHEVFNFLRVGGTSETEVAGCLNALAERNHIFRFGNFYSIQADENNIQRRIKGNTEADKYLKVAKTKARFIARFPFVRAVMASGSLSKGYMDENSDLDFFIVTEPDRLWIARTLLVMYKRIFLFNSHKQFCVNYFVDTAHLEIEEKNLFTATELATLIPLYNVDYYLALHASNQWVQDFFPNFRKRSIDHTERKHSNSFGRFCEFVLNPFVHTLDNFFMRMTRRRWNKIYGKNYGEKDFRIAFKSKRYVSKNHPKHYQKKILELYQLKLAQYEGQFEHLAKHE